MKFALTYGNPAPEACLKTYGAGAKALIDTFGGMVPCVVKRVVEPGRGQYATEGKIEVEVKKSMAGYREGEVVMYSASKIVPPEQVRRREYSSVVNTLYRWA